MGYRITDATTTAQAYGFTDGETASGGGTFFVQIMLDRVESPDQMLQQDWHARQVAISDSDLWTRYGADPEIFQAAVDQITSAGLEVIPDIDGYSISSPATRTIWVALQGAEDFATLFGTSLQYSPSQGMFYWDTNLELPEDWGVVGLWISNVARPLPSPESLGSSPPATLPTGPQSPGNSGAGMAFRPQNLATRYYNFPIDGSAVQTGVVGLIATNTGTYLSGDPTGSTFSSLLDDYLSTIGTGGAGEVSVQDIGAQIATAPGPSLLQERSADVGIVAAINPNSDIQLFNGVAFDTFAAIQSSIWRPVAGVLPEVTSSSFSDIVSPTPGSPFWTFYQQLYIDAALMNQTSVTALGDKGSGGGIGNGLTNVFEGAQTQPTVITVGGTSLSSRHVASTDPTLAPIYEAAIEGTKSILWQLVMGGLMTMPAAASDLDFFIETVWNQYYATSDAVSGYTGNLTSAGGVDPTQLAPPWYQAQFGLTPITSDSLAQGGRGVPDVSANAGGNLKYWVPTGEMEIGPSGAFFSGTSAGAPLWASLITQFNYIFKDQGLPNLGFMNDLLYIASAIAPASFNDVTVGNNNSTFYYDPTGNYTIDGNPGFVTNIGYSAGAGYDYVTGLGSPNGVLLGRALAAIAHGQSSFGDLSGVLTSSGADEWTSGADQTLLFQTVSPCSVSVDIDIGGIDLGFWSGGTQSYAWTARLAQQALQPDFDANLVRLFDKAGQGGVSQSFVVDGDSFSVSLNGSAARGDQVELTSDYGFASFTDGSSGVTVARAVAVAQTAGGADDQMAVVRVRQNGQDSLGVTFYRADDLSGMVAGLKPGETGYAAAVQAAAYQLASGGTFLGGPGYGNFTQNQLLDVDAGDFVAMALSNRSSGLTYWAFSQANPDEQGHLWSYGLNTWGWEDTYAGGDRDFNDLIVQLDFTSAAGSGLLV